MKVDKTQLAFHVFLIIFLAITLAPLLYLIESSFATMEYGHIIIPNLTLANFVELFHDSAFIMCFINGFSRYRIKVHDSIFFTLLTTRMGPAAGFVIPFYLLLSKFGLVNTIPGMILVYIMLILAFSVWLMRGFMENAPLLEQYAAMVDGYSEWQSFRLTVLPHIYSGIGITATFCFLFLWNESLYNLILAGSAARTVTPYIFTFVGSMKVPFGKICAATLLSMIPVIILLLILGRRIVRGFALGMVR
jgi:multiple sugar transport system permease protein